MMCYVHTSRKIYIKIIVVQCRDRERMLMYTRGGDTLGCAPSYGFRTPTKTGNYSTPNPLRSPAPLPADAGNYAINFYRPAAPEKAPPQRIRARRPPKRISHIFRLRCAATFRRQWCRDVSSTAIRILALTQTRFNFISHTHICSTIYYIYIFITHIICNVRICCKCSRASCVSMCARARCI